MTRRIVAEVLTVVSVLALTAAAASEPVVTPSKRALLVGIDRYAAVTDLAGCVNDVEAMRALLVGKYDFPPENVDLLKDDAASRAGILLGLRGLIDRTSAGDVVVFHYSGHGSRMRDTPYGDEADGWDETIVPQDSRTPEVFDISDDELHALLAELAAKTRKWDPLESTCRHASLSIL